MYTYVYFFINAINEEVKEKKKDIIRLESVGYQLPLTNTNKMLNKTKKRRKREQGGYRI